MYKQHTYSIIAAAALLFIGCSNGEQQEQSRSISVQKEQTQKSVEQKTVMQTTEEKKQLAVAAADTAKEEQKKAEASVSVQTKQAEVPKSVAPTPLVKKEEVKEKVETKVEEEVKKAEPKVAKATVDASTLYQKNCLSCHGPKGDKQALRKSDLIGGWSAKKVQEALKGYRAKTRNVHGMGKVMQGQAQRLSDEDIKALGEYIEKLK